MKTNEKNMKRQNMVFFLGATAASLAVIYWALTGFKINLENVLMLFSGVFVMLAAKIN